MTEKILVAETEDDRGDAYIDAHINKDIIEEVTQQQPTDSESLDSLIPLGQALDKAHSKGKTKTGCNSYGNNSYQKDHMDIETSTTSSSESDESCPSNKGSQTPTQRNRPTQSRISRRGRPRGSKSKR